MREEIYDVIVLGGGAGGIPAAIRAAQLGGKVAVAESHDLGGQCMNRGCIPFGNMMVAANIAGGFNFGKNMGVFAENVRTDFGVLKGRQEALIGSMRQGVKSILLKNGVTIIKGKGILMGKGRLRINEKTVRYKNIILASGGQWKKPPFPGGELDDVVNTDYLLRTDRLPERCLLWGTNPVLNLVGQFLQRFRSRVTIATPGKTILSNETKTLATRLARKLKNEGITIRTQTEIESVTRDKDGLHVVLNRKGAIDKIVVDKLITLERSANLKSIGVATLNFPEGAEYLWTNEKMETAKKDVYAIGDLTGPASQHYSHRAAQTGIVAAENSMGLEATINPKATASVLFTEPQVVSIGLTPKEAKAAGYKIVVGSSPLSMNPLGMILAENEGLVEVVAEEEYGEVLGIQIIGTNAAEMAGQAVLALQMEATLEELAWAPIPHPTLSESIAEAARDALGCTIYT